MTAAEAQGEGHEPSRPGGVRAYIQSGLGPLGLEAGEAELAVIEAVDALYRPATEALLRAELDDVAPEPGADMSRGPRALERK
jgi:hypothetical protein